MTMKKILKEWKSLKKNRPNENLIKCFVNIEHPFYTKHVKVNDASYSAYKRVIFAIALADWSAQGRDPPVTPKGFLKLIDNYLKGKAALD